MSFSNPEHKSARPKAAVKRRGLTIRQEIWLLLADDWQKGIAPQSAPDINFTLAIDKASVYLNKMAAAGEVIRVPRTVIGGRVTFYVDEDCLVPDDISLGTLKNLLKGN